MKLRIIVIDDEESIRDTFRWHLEGQGHEVITAECPESISNFANDCNNREHACCDFLFVDHNMPGMTGLAFLEHSFSTSCKLPTQNKILMSGSLTPDLADRVENMGCIAMHKPIRLSQIDTIIEGGKSRISSERLLTDLTKLTI